MNAGKPSPEQVKELWAYVNYVVACLRKEDKKYYQMRVKRDHCLMVLMDGRLKDDEALTQVKRVIG